MSGGRTALLVRTLVVGAVVLGTAGFVTADKTVTVSVDGEATSVRTFSATVQDVLQEEGLVVGPHDSVVPAPSAGVDDGDLVEVSRGRLVTLTVDGVPRQVWTTARTVDELVAALGSRYQSAISTASRSQRIPLTGLSVDLRLPKVVTIRHDGTSTKVVTSAPSVAAVLFQAGVEVGGIDLLSADLALAPVDGMTVTLVRVTTDRVTSRRTVPYSIKKKADASLYAGVTRVVTPGRSGVQRTTYALTLYDGTVVTKEKVDVQTVRKPVTQIVVYGTKARPSSSTAAPTRRRSTSGVDALNWPALAQCESSGNPRAVGGGGIYFGLYQFNLGTWHGVGGVGNPVDAAPAEQTYRAKLLYRNRGAQPWPVCGHLLYT